MESFVQLQKTLSQSLVKRSTGNPCSRCNKLQSCCKVMSHNSVYLVVLLLRIRKSQTQTVFSHFNTYFLVCAYEYGRHGGGMLAQCLALPFHSEEVLCLFRYEQTRLTEMLPLL